ncbi:hypothetical protein TVAG_103920 [Trichomonas vaginalis G3]|uniref:Exportin-1/Importin-beta-like domain-containing protein n=1 Tax=Trichomonas vaginalis (strain ATCC PRA-98 / G3) TaxID=412133 RepID=A2FN31_TRIV3|nr:exportin 1/5 family [Trichomonas vaginalis G3]EAX93673.1 hypothetical protein TVAG_103920 [Trichomonas vaginalis G3]KAI5540906.1 exportin 1/5 family [Trichomonas vaginalis G3]|eukprot:XP_001306603.1 hypothetical protein [Trichomonas vaginalis G3]
MSENLEYVEEMLAVPESAEYEQINQANQVISEWSTTCNVIVDGALILSRNTNLLVRQRVASAMVNQIQFQWGSIQPDVRNDIKKTLIASVRALQDNKLTLRSLCIVISRIACYDLPTEWDDFFEFCFINESMPVEIQQANMLILARYSKEVNCTKLITQNHRIQVREQLIQFELQIEDSVKLGFQTPEIAPSALKLLLSLLRWTQKYEMINKELVHKLLFDFLPNEIIQKTAIKCLRTIFIERNDTFNYYNELAPIVIIALNTLKDPVNPSLAITHSKLVKIFLIDFMGQFLPIIRIFSLTSPATVKDEQIIKEFNTARDEEISVIADYGFKFEEYAQMIVDSFNIILSLDIEEVEDNFWELWHQIFQDIKQESYRHSKISYEPVILMQISTFFDPMMNVIRENIYRLLPAAADEDVNCSAKAKVCFAALASLDNQKMMEFLNNQPHDVSFFFALCSFDYLYDSSELLDDIGTTTMNYLEEINEDSDPDIICALMGMCARLSLYLSSNNENFSRVISFLIGSLDSQELKVRNSAASALIRVIQNSLNYLTGNTTQLTQSVIEESEKLMNNLDSTSMKYVFVACSMLIRTVTDQKEVNQIMDTLYQPVIDALAVFFDSPENNKRKAIDALDIILNCIIQIPAYGQHYAEIFVPALMQLAENVFKDVQYSEICDYLLAALANIIAVLNYEDGIEYFNQVLSMVSQFGVAVGDSVFKFIAVVRNEHDQIEEMWPDIYKTFVEPVMANDPPPIEALAIMMKNFTVSSLGFDFVVDIMKRGIEAYEANTNDAAIGMWNRIAFYEYDSNIKNDIITAISDIILPTAFQSVFDMTHSASLDSICQFISDQVRYLKDLSATQHAKEVLLDFFPTIVPEPTENLYSNFLNFIFDMSTQQFKIYTAIQSLISSMRVVSPVDADQFKIVKRSNFFSMLFPFMFGALFEPFGEAEPLQIGGPVFLSAPFEFITNDDKKPAITSSQDSTN